MACERCERLTRERDEARIDAEACRQSQQAHQFALSAEREAHAKARVALLKWQMGEGDTSMERECARLRAELDNGKAEWATAMRDIVALMARANRAEADAAALRVVLDGIEAWLHDVRGMNISPGWAEIYGGVLAKLDRLCAEHGVRMGGTSESR